MLQYSKCVQCSDLRPESIPTSLFDVIRSEIFSSLFHLWLFLPHKYKVYQSSATAFYFKYNIKHWLDIDRNISLFTYLVPSLARDLKDRDLKCTTVATNASVFNICRCLKMQSMLAPTWSKYFLLPSPFLLRLPGEERPHQGLKVCRSWN